MPRKVTLGLIQADTEIGNVKANVEKGVKLIAAAAAKGAQVVILPELFTTGYNTSILGPRFIQLAENINGPSITAFAAAAKENGVYVMVGFVEERGVPGVVYNSAAFISPEGKVIDSYAKTHLWGGERIYFAKGNNFPIYQTEYGLFAPGICYDVGFPEVGRLYALKGAELMLVISAWRIEDADIWENNCIARATDNLFFVAGCNRVGYEDNLHLIGKSKVLAPRGHYVAQAPMDKEDILIATIDLDEIKEARRECLYMIDRRPELYGPLASL
ncbi:nitrilase-related carbon-nitrogen hydrolase [Moorella sulfitireducens]|uniref:nitrilase-related carbon-nitrogen hydrolase n=1 Tax=Neomoorella sulfitireducens TaxID=2972948 RepID=UPI0021AC48A9|nr:nitrilase-related carbon-nitrogen hydrolase [Moorella sulfitireducens]